MPATPLLEDTLPVFLPLGDALVASGDRIVHLPLPGELLDALEHGRGSYAPAHVVSSDDASVPLRQQHGCA